MNKLQHGQHWLLLCLFLGLAACLQPANAPAPEATVLPTPATAVADNNPHATAPATPVVPSTPTIELAYPIPTPPTGVATGNSYPPPAAGVYLPHVANNGNGGATATPLPTATPIPSPTPIPTLDFAAIHRDLQAQGQEIAYVKIGFHVGPGGNTQGIEEWMRRLDTAGIPFFLKAVDTAGPLVIGQELRRASGVPHTLVFRRSVGKEGTHIYDVPNYDLPPAEAAARHWALHVAEWPPELDPNIIWMETLNEVDKNRSEWLAQFALETAAISLREGRKWAAFGWSSGEPEPEDWQSPAMLEFLRLAGNHPDRLAIALHEYSFEKDDIGDAYPYKVGRFQELFRICDRYGLPRPTVLITEWGWVYQDVPKPHEAIADIAWASRLYAPYPEIKGAAIWYLGPGFGGIATSAQQLIYPVMVYTLQNYFTRPTPPQQAIIDPPRHAP